MATEAVERILQKEKENEAMIADARVKADEMMEDAKNKALEERNRIVSEAKSKAEDILGKAESEVNKMYGDAEKEAEIRKNAIFGKLDSMKEKSVDAVCKIMFD